MKCYVINNEYETIYEGSVVKVSSDGGTEYQATIKNVYIYDGARKLWECHEDSNLNQKTLLERNAYSGTISEYPNAIIAENACKQKMR